MTSEVDVLKSRVTRLEQANRTLRIIFASALVVSAALVSMGLHGKPRTIEAEKLVILDSHGRQRLVIGTPEVAGTAVDMKSDAPGIWLSDENDSDRAILTPEGLYFANEHEKPLVDLSSGPGEPELRFYGPGGKIVRSVP